MAILACLPAALTENYDTRCGGLVVANGVFDQIRFGCAKCMDRLMTFLGQVGPVSRNDFLSVDTLVTVRCFRRTTYGNDV